MYKRWFSFDNKFMRRLALFLAFCFDNHVAEIYEQALGVVSGKKTDWLYNLPIAFEKGFFKRFNIDLWQNEMNPT